MGDPRYLATVNCDRRKWVAIPTSWGGDAAAAKKWADAEAARRWDAWAAQHPGLSHPGPEAVERTGLELKVYADKYGGAVPRRPGEDTTYLYLPDPNEPAFITHVGVDPRPESTVQSALADFEDDGTSVLKEFTTDALGPGRKIKVRGDLDKRPGDPSGPPGEFVTVAYIFDVPERHGMVLVRATDSGPERIGAADDDLDEFVRGITVAPGEEPDTISDLPHVDSPRYYPTVHCDTRKWQASPANRSGGSLTFRYLPDPIGPALVMQVRMDDRPGMTVEKALAEFQPEGTAPAQEFEASLGTARKLKLRGACCYFFPWPDQGVIAVRATGDPERIAAADADLDEFVRCMSVSCADPSAERHPRSRDLDRGGLSKKTAGEAGHSFFGTPLTQVLHAEVHCDLAKWVQVPLEWDEQYPSPPQWADAMAKQRWDAWVAQHPGAARPASDAVAQTARDLQKVAEYYGGFDEMDAYERLTYVYLPDPSRRGIVTGVAVSDLEGETVDRYMAGIEPDTGKAGSDSHHAQLDPSVKPVSEAFTTEALGEGRKITAHGTADPRPSDPPGPPGVWAETRYAFPVPGRHDLVEVNARSSDPASLAAAVSDLDEFVRGISTKRAQLPDLQAGPYDVDALALLRAVHDRRQLQTILRECVGVLVLWTAAAIAVHAAVPDSYNLHHRMGHDGVVGIVFLGAIAMIPAALLFRAKTRDLVGRAAAALVSGVEPQVLEGNEFHLYGPQVARGLVPLLRRKPLFRASALLSGVGAIPMIALGVVAISEQSVLGVVFLAVGGFGVYNTVGLIRFFADSERYIQSTTADASLPDSVAALASGERVVIDLQPRPGKITLGLPIDAKPPSPAPPRSHATLIGAAALSLVVLLGLGDLRYTGRYHPTTAADPYAPHRRTVTLNYIGAVTSRPEMTIVTGPTIGQDIQVLLTGAGVPNGGYGAAWQFVVTQFFRVPNPSLDIADLVAKVTVADIKTTPCAGTVARALSTGTGKPAPKKLAGLPAGWYGIQRPGPDNDTCGVTFAGCEAGTLVVGRVYSPFPAMPDATIASSSSKLVAAIAQRGIAQFRADTAP